MQPPIVCLSDTKQAALFFDNVIPVTLDFIGSNQTERTILNELIFGMCEGISQDAVKDITKTYTDSMIDLALELNVVLSLFLGIKEILMQNLSDPENVKIVHILAKDLLKYFSKGDPLERIPSLQKLVRKYKKDAVQKDPEQVIEGVIEMFKLTTMIDAQSLPEDSERLIFAYIYFRKGVLFKRCYFFSSFMKDISSKIPQYSLPHSILLPKVFEHFYCPEVTDCTLSLAGLNLVDTCNLEWDQIIEFRKDEAARYKLKKLLSFMNKNYSGKSFTEIEDDLGGMYYDYLNVCKDWKFETRRSSLNLILDSKDIRKTIAATAGFALFGEPVLASGILLAGASIEIAKLALHVATQKHAFNKLKRDHELAYLIDVKEEAV